MELHRQQQPCLTHTQVRLEKSPEALRDKSEFYFSGDPFSESDLNDFLAGVYDLRSDEGREKEHFASRIFLSSQFFFHL